MVGEIISVGLIVFLIVKELTSTSETGLANRLGQNLVPFLMPLLLVLGYMVIYKVIAVL